MKLELGSKGMCKRNDELIDSFSDRPYAKFAKLRRRISLNWVQPAPRIGDHTTRKDVRDRRRVGADKWRASRENRDNEKDRERRIGAPPRPRSQESWSWSSGVWFEREEISSGSWGTYITVLCVWVRGRAATFIVYSLYWTGVPHSDSTSSRVHHRAKAGCNVSF